MVRTVSFIGTTLLATATVAAPTLASAQDYAAARYGQGQGQDYRDAPLPLDASDTPMRDVPPPPGYDGTRPPPPPPGYAPNAADGQVDQDRRYEAYAEDWSQRYCTKARSNAGAGAVIGGLFGALLGAGVSGRRDQGTGALVGGLAGAAGGAAIGSSTANQTSPGCPPGYVVVGGAPAFYYQGYGDPYEYAAPGWYQPWFFYEGRWSYRPYPYHAWYYRTYFGGPGYGRFGGGYGRAYGYGRGYGGRGGYGYRRGR